jgi:hypothetical protein
MPKSSTRKFGEVPEWAKTGAISLANYPYRAEAHCALKSRDRGGMHPTITRTSPDFVTWVEYFRLHLGGDPLSLQMLMDASMVEMTVPELVPQWFDPSFTPSIHYEVKRSGEKEPDAAMRSKVGVYSAAF